ncbi:MAG: mycolipenoyl-CoA---2-(long-chain-fatty acyl)-trehalose mycolipenoyltransferase, partial [Mycobacterium sp.]|nr:mycolipenoyl-CoA---2-(long-chain-fatty acyl)-trehalose mycolipenoyltransferase [Mycobacterium sp.]
MAAGLRPTGRSITLTARRTRELLQAYPRMPATVIAAGVILISLPAWPKAAVQTVGEILRIGKITIGSIGDWTLSPGVVISWHPTTAARERARQAPVSSVPVSYMQAQHLRGYYGRTAVGLDYSRQIIATCEVPGQCDISAMNNALNAYLRRHDTYRSWFEYTSTGAIIRHTINDPADIEFTPIDHGKMTAKEVHDHVVATPNPLQWECFTFGIIQSESHFTFYACIDHVHGDAA